MFTLKKEFAEYENKSLRLPKDLINTVQQLANENNMSFNKVVIQCIEYALDNMDNKNNFSKNIINFWNNFETFSLYNSSNI